MKLHYNGKYEQVKLAVEDANDLLSADEFYNAIEQCTQFNCTKKSPVEVAQIIKESRLEIEVKIYKPRWRYSTVLGYFTKSHPNNVFLNFRKLYRNTGSISNTIIHEYVHATDNSFDNNVNNFGHNCGIFKNTAPYAIGNIAELFIDGYKTDDITSELIKFEELDYDRCLTDMEDALINEENLIEDLRIVESF